jgi:RNA polymerase subunit RPABC4/transcription elongation factor Spt4
MESITSLIVGAASVLGAIAAALLGGLTIWAFRDIRSRTRDPFAQFLATVLVGVVPVAGILVYLMLRPKETLSEAYVRALEEESLLSSIENQEFCPTCGRRVDGDMQWCPSCHAKLRNACGNCGRAVHLSWDLCPYCGSGQTPEQPVASAKIKVGQVQPKRVAQSANNTQPRAVPRAAPAEALPSQSGAAEAVDNGASGVLDRFGGAVGSVVDRVNARIQKTGSTPPVTPGPDGNEPTEVDMPAVKPGQS